MPYGHEFSEHHLGGWTIAPFFGIQNLFDAAYNSNVRINAFGGRFFEPAPDVNVYGGVTLAYHCYPNPVSK